MAYLISRGMNKDIMNHQPIIFFDGFCHICNSLINFLIKRDRGYFLFAPLQGETAQNILPEKYTKGEMKTLVLFDKNGVHTQSDAFFHILKALPFPWKLGLSLSILPKVILDKGYSYFSSHRYVWFGKRSFCRIPTQDEKNRFLP